MAGRYHGADDLTPELSGAQRGHEGHAEDDRVEFVAKDKAVSICINRANGGIAYKTAYELSRTLTR